MLDAGLAKSLMLDYWEGDDVMPRTDILCPAIIGSGGYAATYYPIGRCIFFDGKNCGLHTTDMKPQECRETMGCGAQNNSHAETALTWNSEKGRVVVEKWKNLLLAK